MIETSRVAAESISVCLRVNLWDFEFGRGKGLCPDMLSYYSYPVLRAIPPSPDGTRCMYSVVMFVDLHVIHYSAVLKNSLTTFPTCTFFRIIKYSTFFLKMLKNFVSWHSLEHIKLSMSDEKATVCFLLFWGHSSAGSDWATGNS